MNKKGGGYEMFKIDRLLYLISGQLYQLLDI